MLLLSCSKTTLNTNTSAFKRQFDFDAVTQSAAWCACQSHNERVAALQIPDDLLPTLSTEQLVDLCMRYPFWGDYAAFDNPIEGIRRVMDGFNGFAALREREDVADALLAYYENINTAHLINNIPSVYKPDEFTIYKLDYLETILASGDFPKIYDENHIRKLKELAKDNLSLKTTFADKLPLESLEKSALLNEVISKVESGQLTQK